MTRATILAAAPLRTELSANNAAGAARLLFFIRWVLVCATLALSGCASSTQLVDHAFSFDARVDSPNTLILDYHYGNAQLPAARPSDEDVKSGIVRQSAGISGLFSRADTLYVKWRIKATGAVHEDTVDLRRRLPANIKDHRIHFVVKEAQLYVYLISPKPNPPGWPTYDPPGYTHKKTYVIYPDQPFPNQFE